MPGCEIDQERRHSEGRQARHPRLSVVRTAWAMAPKPPMPEAMMQAVRVRSCSLAGCQPAWARAWSEASSASGMKRSILRWSLGETTASMSQPPSGSRARSGTWPATWPGTSGARSSGSRLRPDAPDSSRRQASSVPRPSGETMPMPVMTTRRGRWAAVWDVWDVCAVWAVFMSRSWHTVRRSERAQAAGCAEVNRHSSVLPCRVHSPCRTWSTGHGRG